jgi:hypothetical protein
VTAPRKPARKRAAKPDAAVEAPGAEPGSPLVESVRRRVAEAGAADLPAAALAVAMAREVDGDSSLTSRTMAARILIEALALVDAAAPAAVEADPLDEIAERRAARRAS